MKKIPLKKIWKIAIKQINLHTPEILTGMGIAGMISSTILAVRSTPAAIEHRENYISSVEEPSTLGVVKAVWKDYIPSIVLTLASSGCLIGSISVSNRRNAAIATAYKLSEAAFSDYREKVVEKIGEKKEQTVREEIARDKLNKVEYSENDILQIKDGGNLCMDSYSGQLFKTNIEEVKQVINKLNYTMLQHQFVSLNDLYYELGLRSVKEGDDLGWYVDKGLIEVVFGSGLVDGKTPCLVLDYNSPIPYDYIYR